MPENIHSGASAQDSSAQELSDQNTSAPDSSAPSKTEPAESFSGSALIAAGILLCGLLTATVWEVGFAFSTPIDWLAHGGPPRLLGLSVVSIIPTFLLGVRLLTKPGNRTVLLLMATVGALPLIAILNGSVYRTVVVKSVSYVQEMMEPAARAMEEGRKETGQWPDDLSESMVGVFGMDVARVYAGQDHFVIATTGYVDRGDGSVIFYSSKAGEWKRFHTDRQDSPAAVAYDEAILGITPAEYRKGVDGAWRKL